MHQSLASLSTCAYIFQLHQHYTTSTSATMTTIVNSSSTTSTHLHHLQSPKNFRSCHLPSITSLPTDVNISDSKRRPSTVKPNQIYHFLLNNCHYHHYFFLDRASTIATFNPKQCHHYHHELPPTPMQRFEYQSDSSQLFLPSSGN